MTDHEIIAVYTGWVRADFMRNGAGRTGHTFPPIDNWLLTREPIVYLWLHYACLFTVMEFLKLKESIPPSVAEEFNELYDHLKLFRNAVFHIQDEAVSRKYVGIATVENFNQKVLRVHDDIGKFLESIKPTVFPP